MADLIKHDAYVVLILVILIFIPEIFGILNSPINNYLIPLGRYVRRFYHILLTLPLLFIYLKLLYEFFINQHLNKKKLDAIDQYNWELTEVEKIIETRK